VCVCVWCGVCVWCVVVWCVCVCVCGVCVCVCGMVCGVCAIRGDSLASQSNRTLYWGKTMVIRQHVSAYLHMTHEQAQNKLYITLWRERENQQDATIRCLLSTLSQHVSGIIMPIFRRTKSMCYCMRCTALVLLDVVGSDCGALRCRVRALWWLLSNSNLHSARTKQ